MQRGQFVSGSMAFSLTPVRPMAGIRNRGALSVFTWLEQNHSPSVIAVVEKPASRGVSVNRNSQSAYAMAQLQGSTAASKKVADNSSSPEATMYDDDYDILMGGKIGASRYYANFGSYEDREHRNKGLWGSEARGKNPATSLKPRDRRNEIMVSLLVTGEALFVRRTK